MHKEFHALPYEVCSKVPYSTTSCVASSRFVTRIAEKKMKMLRFPFSQKSESYLVRRMSHCMAFNLPKIEDASTIKLLYSQSFKLCIGSRPTQFYSTVSIFLEGQKICRGPVNLFFFQLKVEKFVKYLRHYFK